MLYICTMENNKLTDGQLWIGVTFNPSKNPEVDNVKASFAKLSDLVLEHQATFGTNTYLFRLLQEKALHDILTAQTSIVKLLTF